MSISHFTLFKRDNGIWYIVYHVDGRVRWKTTRTEIKSEALKRLTEFEKYFKDRLENIRLSEFIEEFLNAQRSYLRPTTINHIYRPAFNLLLKICGNRPLTRYTLRDIEFFKGTRLQSVSPTTVNIEFRALKAAFNTAVKWQMLEVNPFALSRKVRVPEKIPSFFSKQKFQAFLAVVKEPVLQELFVFAALTGMRLGEILNLQWKQIDIDSRLITIANTEHFMTKSGRWRVLPMSYIVIELLKKRAQTDPNPTYVFHRNGTMIPQSYVSHKFKKYVRKAGINDALKFHSLRHTFATWALQHGVPIYDVQKLLGHSDLRTTELYSHLVASELHSSVNRIAGFLEQGT